MTAELTPDIPKLRKYVEWVEYQERLPVVDREWEQKHYVWTRDDAETIRRLNIEGPLCVERSCGTAYCVAGKVQFDETGSENSSTAEDYAMKALGLDFTQAHCMFQAGNDAADIRRFAEEIAGERL
jgi:hypothetical protein